jgi:hypothetical protein
LPQVSGCGPEPLRVEHVALRPDPPSPAPHGAAAWAAAGGAAVAADGSAAARVEARAGGRRLAADALLYPHLDEEVLVVWADGRAHEFRCARSGGTGARAARAPPGSAPGRRALGRPRLPKAGSPLATHCVLAAPQSARRFLRPARGRRWEVPRWTKDAAVGATTGAVRTPMPGKLVKVLVSEGQVRRQGAGGVGGGVLCRVCRRGDAWSACA